MAICHHFLGFGSPDNHIQQVTGLTCPEFPWCTGEWNQNVHGPHGDEINSHTDHCPWHQCLLRVLSMLFGTEVSDNRTVFDLSFLVLHLFVWHAVTVWFVVTKYTVSRLSKMKQDMSLCRNAKEMLLRGSAIARSPAARMIPGGMNPDYVNSSCIAQIQSELSYTVDYQNHYHHYYYWS